MNEPRDDLPGALPDDERLRALYRQLPADEPPAHLDDAILAAARRAAGSRPRPLYVRWRVPLAAAASLLLATVLLREWAWQGELPRTVSEDSVAAAPAETVPAAPAVIAENAPQRSATAQNVLKKDAPEKEIAAVAEYKAKAAAEPALQKRTTDLPASALADRAAEQPAVQAGPQVAGNLQRADALAESAAAGAAKAEADADRRELRAAKSVASGAASAAPPALAVAPAPAAAPPAVAAAATVAGRPWPLGLLPDLAPDTACARLIQDSGGSCRGRYVDGVLELELRGSSPDWLPQLQASLAELGWQADDIRGDGVQYSRAAGGGARDVFSWRLQKGVLTLRLNPAR